VLQFANGMLRVWRGPPETGHPNGRLHQETLVGEGVDRQGHEKFAQKTFYKALLSGPFTERGHAHGAGLGVESPFGILHVPREVNQALQNRGVELLLRRLRDASPPGVEWHYVTEVIEQPREGRLMSISYRIDVTVKGARVRFAEFNIHVDALPARANVKGRHIVSIDPLTFRSSDHATVQEILGRLEQLVDVPDLVLHGLPRGERAKAAEVVTRLSLIDPEFVRSTVSKSDGKIRAIKPDRTESFDPVVWAQRLNAHFEGDSRASFVVVDLRGLNLIAGQVAKVEEVIAGLPKKDARRILLIR
jgi:hypothetical protein